MYMYAGSHDSIEFARGSVACRTLVILPTMAALAASGIG